VEISPRTLDVPAPASSAARPAPRLGSADEAKSLLESGLDDLPEALAQVDDSGGEGTEIIERATALHLAACQALRPVPVALAEELFERACDDAFGTFDRADETYAELLGKTGLTEYRQLAEAAYARLPALAPGGDNTHTGRRRLLTTILDRFAERDGDVDRRIALRRAALQSAHDYLQLAQFCLSQNRPALALQAAEEGTWLFEDHRATPALVVFVAERLAAEGRGHEAIATLWRGFEHTPSLSLFQALLELDAADAAERALGVVRARQGAAGKADRWRIGALVELELEMLMVTARLLEAWEVSRRHSVPDELLLRLARESEATLPGEAVAAYRRAVERQIGLTNRGAYEAAWRLLVRLAAIETPGEHAAFVDALGARHRAKRSLLPMLNRHMVGRVAS
jgi:tetratricopeptide (TPR) repeat protein